MQLGMIGLGKMGANMRDRLRQGGHEVVGYDLNPDVRDVDSLPALVEALDAPRVVWVMVPHGAPTQSTVDELGELLAEGDLVIEGGNSHFTDDIKHHEQLGAKGIGYVDCGVSGGIWGVTEGYGLMCGGEAEWVEKAMPIFDTLRPEGPREEGWVHAGDIGAGHYAKMVHNGIEYGLMQAYAEGWELLEASDIVTHVPDVFESWREGTVIRSWLLDLMVRAMDDTSTFGAYMQFRFLPSNRMWQFDLEPAENGDYRQLAVKALAPEGTTHAVIYLYTHAHPTPKVMVDNVRLVSGVEPPPPGPAELVPPQYDTLKDLRLETAIVDAGRPAACIVAPADGRYSAAADKLQAAVRAITGVEIPIVTDEFAFGGTRPEGNLIALGNRSTNRFIEQLYNQYLCLLDLKYPGPGGSVVRSLHNMRAEGVNVLFAGGSDDAGVAAATDVLIGKLREAGGGQGGLTVGRLMEIQLPEGVNPPDDVREMKIWEASDMYRDTGYFGWNSISKHMAMYYMTGREQHAREMVRLAFPDAEALKQITEIDGERIENKDDPLAGTYHYNSHMMILFWDLIEESPVFSDEERLRITNAFARQLDHRKNEGVYTLTQPPALVSSRHGQWSAVSLYCLGRYFNWYYPNAIWEQCVRGGELAFASLHRHSWVVGEADNLYWYATGTAPILTYMTLTGDRVPLKNGVLPELLKGQEILASGHVPDWSLESCSMGYLNKAAYLTGGGRWVEYRSRCKTDTDAFRLGQSYWPEESIVAHEPDDMVGRWNIHPLPEPAWLSRGNGFDLDESFYFGSFRTTTDENGDFILIDGFNGQSRNPYHAFAILELRLAGATLLKGYRNQVLTRADGMVEPTIAIDAALRYADVVGDTAACVGEVPRAAFCNWRRTLAQRTGVLLLDEPTTFLDVRHQLDLMHLLRRLVSEHGLAVALVLHDLNQAAGFADHMLLLAGGGVVARGRPTEVLTADHVRTAFEVDARVVVDDATGIPTCVFPGRDAALAP